MEWEGVPFYVAVILSEAKDPISVDAILRLSQEFSRELLAQPALLRQRWDPSTPQALRHREAPATLRMTQSNGLSPPRFCRRLFADPLADLEGHLAGFL